MRIANLLGRLVLLDGARALDVATASEGRFGPSPATAYQDWDAYRSWADAADLTDATPYDVGDLGAPAPCPSQVFAIGLNYREHAAESNFDAPTEPVVFTKYASCLTGPTGTVALVPGKIDWEAELVVVIGRGGHHIARSSAWDHVAGLTIGQDISERVLQRSGPAPQFSMAKSYPKFGPTGPAVVTIDELANPNDLAIGCILAGEKVQDARTKQMIFPIDDLIARLSRIITFFPGDLIFTGTPSGVGMGREPQRFIQPGEELVTFIEGLGEMRHRFQPSTSML